MRNRPLCIICLCLFLFISAMVYWGGARFVKELRPSNIETYVEDGAVIQVSGEIYQKEIRNDYHILYLKNNSITYRGHSFQESNIIIYDKKKQKNNIGNKIVVNGESRIFEKERNPGNFNQKLFYQKLDIHASVWVDSMWILQNDKNEIMDALSTFRSQWKQKLCTVMGEKDGNILAAMLIGEKGDMDDEIKTLYQINGIGHVLSISGLHLSFIGIGIYKILRRITGSYGIGGIMGILFLGCYILMIGFTVSVVRALVMFLFRVGADMTGRHYDNMTALTVAAVICIIWRPLYLYDGGFWLSFGAVLAVIVVIPIFKDLPCQTFWSSMGINLFLFPIQLYYFFEFPVYSTILNLLIIPLASALLFGGIVGSVMTIAAGVPGEIILRLCKSIFWIYEKSCEIALDLPVGRIVIGKPELWQIALYYVFLGIAFVFVQRRKKEDNNSLKMLVTVGTSVLLLFIGIFSVVFSFEDYGKVKITMIDVGQGDGIFIKGPKGNTYLIDGGSSDVSHVGQYRIEPFLKSQGVGKLDYVFVTHGDSDHINGISEIIERRNIGVEIETIIFPELNVWDEKLRELHEKARKNGVKTVLMKKGQELKEGELKLVCLAPDSILTEGKNKNRAEYKVEAGNAASLILTLNYNGFDMLFTGDVEGEGEEKLMKELSKYEVKYEVLKAAHHGSKNSSSEDFLEIVQPCYTLISAGTENRYGHPHKETIERLHSVESKVMTTIDNGAIMLEICESKMRVSGWKK